MKKHILAAAVAAAVAVPAMAQVTVSGVLDIGAYNTSEFTAGPAAAAAGNSTETSRTGQENGWSTSIIRFSASEDLGGGLKAGATISSFLTNANTMGGRERFLTLSGDFGSVNAGRFVPSINGYGAYAYTGTNNTAGTSDTGNFDFIAGTLGSTPTRAAAAGAAVTAGANAVGTYEIQDNIIEYTSPNMNGFNVQLGVVRSTSDADGTNHLFETKIKQDTVRLNYSAGPLNASLAHGTRNVETEGAAGAATQSEGNLTWFGVNYNFGPAVLSFAHRKREDSTGAQGANMAAVSDLTVNNIGVRIPLGALTLAFSAYNGTDDRTVAQNDERDISGNQISATYALSKRTSVYAAIGSNENKIKTGANVDDVEFKGTSFGVVHSF